MNGEGGLSEANEQTWKTDGGSHWSFISYDIFSAKGSTRMHNACYNFDGKASTRHEAIALKYNTVIRGLIERRYMQLKWASACTTGQLVTVQVKPQHNGFDCGPLSGGYAEAVVKCDMFTNKKQYRTAVSDVGPFSVLALRRQHLLALIGSIPGAAVPPDLDSISQRRERSPPPPPNLN